MLCTGISLLASDNQDHAGFVVQIRPSVPEYAVARMPPAGLEDRDQLAHAKYAPERAFFGNAKRTQCALTERAANIRKKQKSEAAFSTGDRANKCI